MRGFFYLVWGWETHSGECAYGEATDSRNACHLARRLSGLIGCIGNLPAMDFVWFGDEERILANAPTGRQTDSRNAGPVATCPLWILFGLGMGNAFWRMRLQGDN